MNVQLRPAQPGDIAECIRIRGLTRENAIPADRLAALGITLESWSGQVARGELPGFVAEAVEGDPEGVSRRMAGYCFGDAASGEIVVLALLPEFEGQGLGQALLERCMALLRERGHTRLFLGCSDNPVHRSHGFYRHLGWVPTGERDGYGDEVLTIEFSAPPTSRTR